MSRAVAPAGEDPAGPGTGGPGAAGLATTAAERQTSAPGTRLTLTDRGTLARVVETWGTVITLEVALAAGTGSPPPGLLAAVAAAMDDCEADMGRIDRLFSTYRDDSVVSALRTGRRTGADLDLADPDDALVITVLDQCRRLRATTGGTFDPWAVRGGLDPSAYVKGWGAGRFADLLWGRLGPGRPVASASGELGVPGGAGGHGAASLTSTAGTASGSDHTGAGTRAGHAVRGVTGVCVNAGGDVSVRGSQADGRAWTVGVRDPRDPATIVQVVEARGGHVATSGLYERGEHLTHTRPGSAGAVRDGSGAPEQAGPGAASDGRAERPGPSGRVLSATVWGPDDGAADALATALFLDGRAGAVWLGRVMDADTGGGRTVPRWGASVVEEGPQGLVTWRLGAVDALA